MTDTVTVADRPDHNRYEIAIGDHIAYLDYRRRDDHVILVHTEVPEALRNRGLGTILAKHGLDEARRAGVEVVVKCPFITTWLRRHHQYDDIVVARVHEDGSVDRQRPNDGPR
jgi:predicted GNAT family acetyltransferase